MERRGFPRSARLRSSREIRELFRTGRRRRCGPLELVLGDSNEAGPRAAIVVPRHGHSAVERNRLRRRLSEIVRLCWLPLAGRQTPPPALIVRARREAYQAGFPELRERLRGCLDLPPC